jgi:hypothetical protein
LVAGGEQAGGEQAGGAQAGGEQAKERRLKTSIHTSVGSTTHNNFFGLLQTPPPQSILSLLPFFEQLKISPK